MYLSVAESDAGESSPLQLPSTILLQAEKVQDLLLQNALAPCPPQPTKKEQKFLDVPI